MRGREWCQDCRRRNLSLLKIRVSAIEVVVEGDLPAEKSKRLAEEVRMKAEAIVGNRCIVVE